MGKSTVKSPSACRLSGPKEYLVQYTTRHCACAYDKDWDKIWNEMRPLFALVGVLVTLNEKEKNEKKRQESQWIRN